MGSFRRASKVLEHGIEDGIDGEFEGKRCDEGLRNCRSGLEVPWERCS